MGDATKRIIVALDTHDVYKASALVQMLSPHIEIFKIGPEFMHALIHGALKGTSEDLATIRDLFWALSGKIFWDVKLHEIPKTIEKTTALVLRLPFNGVCMMSMHTTSGREAIGSALKAFKECGNTKLLGVSKLSSLKRDEYASFHNRTSSDMVLRFARILFEEGAHGIICGAKELRALSRSSYFDSLIKVVPGVRPLGTSRDDHADPMTPEETIQGGADYVVIGRPITDPTKEIGTPLNALEAIASQIEKVL